MRNGLWSFLAFLAAGAFLALLFRPEPAVSRAAAPAARKAMPDLHLPTLDGQNWSLPDHRGNVVLLNFWASWCPPCREETPGLIRVAEAFRGKGLEVAGVSLDENLDAVRRFSHEYRVSYPLLLPKDNSLASGIESLPTTFLIDRQGRVANVFVGAVSERTLRQAVENLLAERL
jgi:peroxiredoxin